MLLTTAEERAWGLLWACKAAAVLGQPSWRHLGAWVCRQIKTPRLKAAGLCLLEALQGNIRAASVESGGGVAALF